MKIAFFTQNVLYHAYSAVFSGWCYALTANGLDQIEVVSIIGDPENDSRNPFPPQVRHVVLRCNRAARAVMPLRRYLEESKPDVLITAVVNINLIALVTKLISGWQGKLIITHHHPLALSHKATWKDNLYAARLLFRFADGSIAVSPEVFEDAVRECGLDRRRMTVIPNVLPPAPSTSVTDTTHPWLDSNRPSGPVFVTISRLAPVKNIPLLLDAFRSVAHRLDARLLIIGIGPDEARIRSEILSKGLEKYVEMLGFVSSPRPYLRKADVFVLASSEEGFGQVLVEAMSERCPVISTDAKGGGPRFVMEGGKYGKLVAPEDPDALAAAMTEMADPVARNRFVALGLRRSEDFSPQAVGSGLLQFIEEIAALGEQGRRRKVMFVNEG